MYPKVLCFAAIIATAIASGYSPAYSSAYVNKYDGHAAVIHVPYAPSHGYYDNRYSLGYGHNYYGHGHHGHQSIDYYAYPKYEFEYKVVDHHTGDIKGQQELRDGDVVKGYYALHQPDGSERAVHYASDKHSGFRANVRYGTHHLVPRRYPHHY